jgi:hypothetical protein
VSHHHDGHQLVVAGLHVSEHVAGHVRLELERFLVEVV